jgi:hypothetical protein
MKKLFAASVFATVLAASTAFAFELPSAPQPIKGIEGPDIRLAEVQHPSLPVEGPEGPDVR